MKFNSKLTYSVLWKLCEQIQSNYPEKSGLKRLRRQKKVEHRQQLRIG